MARTRDYRAEYQARLGRARQLVAQGLDPKAARRLATGHPRADEPSLSQVKSRQAQTNESLWWAYSRAYSPYGERQETREEYYEPYESHYEAEERVEPVVDAALHSLITQATWQIIDAAVALIEDSASQVGNHLVSGLPLLESQIRVALSTVLHDEASLVQEAILEAYEEMVEAREGPASQTHYRPGPRKPFTLRRALASPDFITVDGYTMNIGNRKLLDAEAAHWHRIAFGAGGRGQGADATFEIRLGDQSSTLRLVEGPSGPMGMPPGRWIAPGGSRAFTGVAREGMSGNDMFYPGLAGWKGPRWLPTRGVRGRDFFAPGLQVLAETLPRAVNTLVNKAITEWTGKHLVSQHETIARRLILQPLI